MQEIFEEDPFLCPECAKVGYCIKRLANQSESTEELTNEDENIHTPYESVEHSIEIMEENLVEQD
jgi:hypothetical protein